MGVLGHVFVHGYEEEDVTPLRLVGHRNIFQILVSYVCVRLHLILRFAGCGLLSLFPCRILPCLCGCAPFYRCDIAV